MDCCQDPSKPTRSPHPRIIFSISNSNVDDRQSPTVLTSVHVPDFSCLRHDMTTHGDADTGILRCPHRSGRQIAEVPTELEPLAHSIIPLNRKHISASFAFVREEEPSNKRYRMVNDYFGSQKSTPNLRLVLVVSVSTAIEKRNAITDFQERSKWQYAYPVIQRRPA